MPPPHLTLANNQRLPQNTGKAPSVIPDASSYPNAPTRTCSGESGPSHTAGRQAEPWAGIG